MGIDEALGQLIDDLLFTQRDHPVSVTSLITGVNWRAVALTRWSCDNATALWRTSNGYFSLSTHAGAQWVTVCRSEPKMTG